MRGRTIGAAVMASLAPAVAVAQPQPRTITITTTTTVTLEPDAGVSDLPPGETAPNTQVTTAVDEPAAAPARDVRFTAAIGLATTDQAVFMADLRAAFGLTRHLAIAGGVTFASETDDLDKPEKALYAPSVALQIWPTSRFWLEAGAGLAAEGHRDPTAIATGAIGVDVLAGAGFAIDAQLRVLAAGDGGGAGFLVGASWY